MLLRKRAVIRGCLHTPQPERLAEHRHQYPARGKNQRHERNPKNVDQKRPWDSELQLAGETGWIDGEYYNIEARTGGGASLSEEQLKPYLQSLLADRFHLKVHWETREENVYALILDM